MIKKIDRLVITSFVPPFIVAFSIAIFVLLMQMLWLYIEDLVGKGLGFFMLVELLSYRAVSIIPLALPIGILIASVMVMGNMAERYELSSIKSAGVPLMRTMRTIILFGIGAAFFSVYTSNTLIPSANLKFGSRMYDIQQKKPALQLEAGVFNYDFQGFTIHIGSKEDDGRTINEVLIYDHSDVNTGRLTQIVAERGEMFTTADERYFVMVLYDGHQYVESAPRYGASDEKYPFVRTTFETWTKLFDLTEFELQRTNEELFKSNRSMMTVKELQASADSLQHKIELREYNLANNVSEFFHFMEQDSAYQAELAAKRKTFRPQTIPQANLDTIPEDTAGSDATGQAALAKVEESTEPKQKNYRPQLNNIIERKVTPPLQTYPTLLSTFDRPDQARLKSKAKSYVRNVYNQALSTVRFRDRNREQRVKRIYDLHMKYGMAVVCIIFVMIGGPMGAIVRKGGFGYPILISIIFFMLFVVLTIFCRKIAETFVITSVMAAWLPCMILFPIGLILTYRAMNDSKLGGSGQYVRRIRRLFANKKTPLKKEQHDPTRTTVEA